MDDRQVGRVLRAVRIRLNLRQVDVAQRAGLSQGVVSDLEHGRLEQVGLATARRVAHALDVRLSMSAMWRGGEADRLLDRAHASIVDHVVGVLKELDWNVLPEFTFNVYGDRGSVDILAWHPRERILLIVEVKATLTDLQNLLASLSKKRRVVPAAAARELGWQARHVATVVVAAGTTGNRGIVARHRSTFDTAFPARSHEVRSWLRRPHGALSGLWFVSTRTVPAVARSARRRVRV
ncbi:MAG TPA: helix-turn-helix transcriptional regulator [Candidatus Limnocylindrales bacterium]|nr:helix-turn-helix transcriptional regulator [Candidatus Limnocylindrales bacterium]